MPTRANNQPAFGVYLADPHVPIAHAHSLVVLSLEGDEISTMTRFDTNLLRHIGLPRMLPV